MVLTPVATHLDADPVKVPDRLGALPIALNTNSTQGTQTAACDPELVHLCACVCGCVHLCGSVTACKAPRPRHAILNTSICVCVFTATPNYFFSQPRCVPQDVPPSLPCLLHPRSPHASFELQCSSFYWSSLHRCVRVAVLMQQLPLLRHTSTSTHPHLPPLKCVLVHVQERLGSTARAVSQDLQADARIRSAVFHVTRVHVHEVGAAAKCGSSTLFGGDDLLDASCSPNQSQGVPPPPTHTPLC